VIRRLLLLAAALPAAAGATEVEAGRAAFAACAACHETAAGSTAQGPSLAGVVGRRAGAREDFRYSRAMQRAGIVWSPEALDAFLADPPNAIPGNRMAFSGVPDPALRRAIIAYLATLR
jgi:cytochrome c2